MPDEFQAGARRSDSGTRPAVRTAPRRDPEAGWRRRELRDDLVESVARQAAARRAVRQAQHRGLLGRLRLSAPRRPRWLEVWGELRRSLRLALVGLLVVAGTATCLAVMPWFRVQQIEVVGGSVVAPGRLLTSAGVGVGDSTLTLNTGRVAQALLAQPWVASAKVQVQWPGTLLVTIRPLPPEMIYQRDGRRQLLASTGAVLGPAGPAGGSSLPLLVDQRPGHGAGAGGVALPARLAAALVNLQKVFPAAYGVSVEQYRLSPVGALEIQSSAGWVADLGPVLTSSQVQSIASKLEALRTVASTVNLKSSAIRWIYLEDPSQVVVSS